MNNIEKIRAFIKRYNMESYLSTDNYGANCIVYSSVKESGKLSKFIRHVGESAQVNEYYDDDSYTCDDCGITIDATAYGASARLNDGLACKDCILKHPADYIETLTDNPNNANTIIPIGSLYRIGYETRNNEPYYNGLHMGDNDNPKVIYKQYKTPTNTVIFHIRNCNPFTTKFDVLTKENETEE